GALRRGQPEPPPPPPQTPEYYAEVLPEVPGARWPWPRLLGALALLVGPLLAAAWAFNVIRSERPGPEGVPTHHVVLRPADLSEDRVVVRLPAEVADVASAGAGRFLVLHLPGQRRLAIFDVCKARIVRTLPAPEGRLLLAGGREHFVAVMQSSGLVARYGL